MNWTPWQILDLYLDDQDVLGLIFWADKINEQNEKVKSK